MYDLMSRRAAKVARAAEGLLLPQIIAAGGVINSGDEFFPSGNEEMILSLMARWTIFDSGEATSISARFSHDGKRTGHQETDGQAEEHHRQRLRILFCRDHSLRLGLFQDRQQRPGVSQPDLAHIEPQAGEQAFVAAAPGFAEDFACWLADAQRFTAQWTTSG